MRKRYLAAIFISALFLISYLSPQVYQDYLRSLVDLAFNFFIPAIFPTVFFISMLLDTDFVQDIYDHNKFLGNLMLTAILAFGGTPTLLSVIGRLDLDSSKIDKVIGRFIAPSFSFIFFLLKPSIGPGFAVAVSSSFFLIPIVLQLFVPLDLPWKKTEKKPSYRLIESAQNSAFNSIKSLYSLLVMIAIIGSLKPIFARIDSPLIAGFLQGVFEYTSGSLDLIKNQTLLGSFLLVSVLSLNGLSSFLAVKKLCSKMNFGRVLVYRAAITVVTLLPLALLVFEGFQNAGWY